jgi:hypothetical protein
MEGLMQKPKLNNFVEKTKKGIDQVKHVAQDTIEKIKATKLKGNVSKK